MSHHLKAPDIIFVMTVVTSF